MLIFQLEHNVMVQVTLHAFGLMNTEVMVVQSRGDTIGSDVIAPVLLMWQRNYLIIWQ